MRICKSQIMAIEMEERTLGLKTQLRELMGMDGTGHGVVTMFEQLGSLGQQKSSYCRPYRGPVRYHTCGRQGPLQQRVGQLLWRCRHSVYETKARGTNDAPLSRKATLAMGIPWDGAKRRIWTQADPLVTGRTEDAVRVKLSYVRVGTKVLNTLLLGTFSPSTLGGRPGDVEVSVSLGFGGRTRGPCLWFGRLGGRRGGGSGRAESGVSGAYEEEGGRTIRACEHPNAWW
jgi:hypothetical protein